jgi:uncharacterized membrane protein
MDCSIPLYGGGRKIYITISTPAFFVVVVLRAVLTNLLIYFYSFLPWQNNKCHVLIINHVRTLIHSHFPEFTIVWIILTN